MRLYHFLNAEYGLLDIRHRRLKIARINELNDPFEFLGVATKSRRLRQRYHRLKDALNDYLGWSVSVPIGTTPCNGAIMPIVTRPVPGIRGERPGA